LKATNLALKFALELAALAAFVYCGTTLDGTAVWSLAAVAVPLAMTVLWGRFAAPKAQRRLPRATRIPFELAVFALAAGALLAAGASVAAAGLSALVLLNGVLLTRFDQWDRWCGKTRRANARASASLTAGSRVTRALVRGALPASTCA
jgi:hypothetical protein